MWWRTARKRRAEVLDKRIESETKRADKACSALIEKIAEQKPLLKPRLTKKKKGVQGEPKSQ